ncbi:Trans-1:2-dihydrobenzene-1:2-diol dehydrogenase-like protein [Leptotrombidium deliense]|uniref:Trans-1,2-dihydrobenzene-1,2-diol dehydrogenase n=1 Tax=Leptotrombidium deliense TaxID=299467 RepID=A0A443SKK9_9ACAR|nr:Trans-1:2-dihydrobenzene-1:2-diol dehydrogenase-like protein [Leptotrombidium deliense]
MAKSCIQWGIVSTGKISHDFTVCLRSLPQTEHRIVAVAARNKSSAEKFAKLHQIPKAYSSYAELAKDPEVQVAYVGTINTEHLNAAKIIIENGKHLLLEKPMTLNLKHTKEVIALAKKKNVFLMEAIWSRFFPSYKFMLEQLKQIGTIHYVSADFGKKVADVDRVAKKEYGGGTVLDLGVYCINLVLMAFGGERPVEIKAVGILNEHGVDTSIAANLKFPNGKLAQISTGSWVDLPCEAHIVGTKGTIKLMAPMHCTERVVVNNKVHEFPLPETVLPCNFQNSSGLRYEAMEVRRCLLNGIKESPFLTHADSMLIAEIQDEIRKQVGVVFPDD